MSGSNQQIPAANAAGSLRDSEVWKLVTNANRQASERSKQKLSMTHGYYVKVMTLLGILQIIGLAFFTKGFLLSRQVLPDTSSCISQQGSSQCLQVGNYKKVVVLVIDALRFDFTIPVEGSTLPFHNNFPILYDTFQNYPENSLLLKFIADPPTTTLQRLKGLTTGSLPTILDAGSNFDGDIIEEDNWLSQLHANSRRVAFAGDDTWTALFSPFLQPNLTYPYDSLNVGDLHTVDNGVIEHIFPLIEEQSDQWDVLVGHFLGVDHCGHRYGPFHKAMDEKLKQMNEVITEVMEKIDDDTLLIIFGDHGMDETGNHGGESKDELEAALFMYSKKPTFGRLDSKRYNIEDLGAEYRAVNQIDLVPTISFALNIPIPFNNLGFPIEEVLMGSSRDYRKSAEASFITASQINNYRHISGELDSDLEVNEMFAELKQEWNNLNNTSKVSDEIWKEFIQKASIYQSLSLERCKDLWARFDMISMSIGIAIIAIALILLIIYSKLIPSVVIAQLNPQFLDYSVAIIFVYGILFASFYLIFRPDNLSIYWLLTLGVAVGIVNGILAPVMDRYSVPWLLDQVKENLIQNGWTYFALFIVLLHSLIFTSNSFIIWEDKIVSFWLSTFGFCAFFKSFQQPTALKKVIGAYHSVTFIALNRVVSTITLCREEQQPKCQSNFKSTWWIVLLLYVSAYILPLLIKAYYRISSSYEEAAPIWISVGLRGTMILSAMMWTLEFVQNDSYWSSFVTFIPEEVFKGTKLVFARLAIGISLIAANIGWSLGPLCIRVEMSSNTNKAASEQEGDILQQSSQKQYETVNIVGYGNVYGSSYFLLVINVLAAVLLVNKPLGQLSLFVLVNQLLTLFELTDLLSIRTNLISVVVLGLLGYSHFFTTGHQATLQAIHWESGFLLTETIVFPLTHLAIVLETFGPFILISLSVALLSLWKIRPSNKPIALISRIVESATSLLIYQLCLTLSTLIMSAHFRRHLMVWKVFAPRFMLNGMVLILMNFIITFVSVGFATGKVLKNWNLNLESS